MEYFVQQLINGVTLGSIYGLIAIGYTMVYGIIGMINFAHGDIYMVAAFIALLVFLALIAIGITAIPLALFLVLLIAMALTALYGWTVERLAYRPLRGSFRLAPLISAIGMSILLQNYVQIAQGARVLPLPPLVTGGHMLIQSEAFPVQISNVQIIVIVTTFALMAAFSLMVARTRLGRDMRACEQDLKMASVLGVNIDRTISLTFVTGAALAAVAGIMYLLYYGVVDFYIGFVAGVKAFTAAVLGGIGNIRGALFGGILLGLIESLGVACTQSAWQDVIAFVVLVLVLMFSFIVAKTRLGRDMRACEQDLKMASLVGVDIDRTISLTFVIGAALASVAGIMYLLYYGVVDFYIGFVAGVKAFTAAVLGGIGSLPGAMLGGLLIGLIETLWSAYFSIEYKDVAAFSVLIIVLIFLPTGILGRPEVEKV